MAMTMDALGAFSHLQSNLPSWITRVSELAAHTSAKHMEYSEAYRRHTTYKPRRRKNSSVRSIHTDDFAPIPQRECPTQVAVEMSTTVEDATTAPQHAGRKRGADETSSIDSSERHAFVSTRHKVIIEYDGHTQKVLEEVVRDIGIARNNIRRGRMLSMPRVGAGYRAGLLNKTVNIGTNNQPGGAPSSISGLAYVRSMRTGGGVVGVSGSSASLQKESLFDYADKQLELAHGLCETAAYQVLRCGDCGTELDGVEEKFQMLLEMVDNEVERLEEEKKKQEQAQSPPEDKENETPVKPPQTSTAARLARVAAITNKQPSTDTPGTIEVDDDEAISVESIDLSAFRSSRIRV
ncbi:uncharacterized protein N7498_008315 [Penicillium cinerascens]|uniref:Uncharacterized protein n=1 Tax=Penicillium cinerascens TaxID=70096 RepID=A0A9W9JF70_9EURO|nr:uncharacterized protein N7498_008315 [Penicillium cinerascens]KAJ5194877.1 hypothetical protein N7498_008315 [Penicillium cinerascens]